MKSNVNFLCNMNALKQENKHVLMVSDYDLFIKTPFQGDINAMCLSRTLDGNFEELVSKLELTENVTEITPQNLLALELTLEGKIARDHLLHDFKSLTDCGASPSINLIRQYDRDDALPFISTDVYSFHVDRSPIPTSTFLCTYFGASSDIVANEYAELKMNIPEIRAELFKLYKGSEEGFSNFLTENYFDLHYQIAPGAPITNLGNGNLWRLAVDHPNNPVLPCVHRAPLECKNQIRLMLIC